MRERSRALDQHRLRCPFFFAEIMKRKTKIPENIWNIICTAAIIAVLIFAAVALFQSFR